MTSHIIQPGRLKHTLYLQSTTKSYGNPGTWANVATNPAIRCSINYLAGSEPATASGERGENRIELVMRYRSDVTYDKRFYDGSSRAFDIVSINNVDELDHKLIVIVVESTR